MDGATVNLTSPAAVDKMGESPQTFSTSETQPPSKTPAVGAGTGGDSFRSQDLMTEEPQGKTQGTAPQGTAPQGTAPQGASQETDQVAAALASQEMEAEHTPGKDGQLASASRSSQLGSAFTHLRKSLTLRRPLSKKTGRVQSAERAQSFGEEAQGAQSERGAAAAETGVNAGASASATTEAHVSTTSAFTRNVSSAFHAVWRSGGRSSRKSHEAEASEAVKTPAATPTMSAKPAIRFEEPNKFFIENYKDVAKPIDFGDKEQATMRHAVMIINCSNCSFNITKKVSKIEIANCKKVQVTFPSVLANVDVQKSQSCKVTATQHLPGMAIETVESLQIYIPFDSKDTFEVTSSGGGSACILYPSAKGKDDHVEVPVPFQFVHRFKGDKLVSEVSHLY